MNNGDIKPQAARQAANHTHEELLDLIHHRAEIERKLHELRTEHMARHAQPGKKMNKDKKHNITMKFTEVIEGLQQGHNYTRSLWNGKKFITLQIPADISRDIIPKMTSLNDEAKELLLDHGDGMIHYRNQVLQVSLDNDDRQNIATYYIPTWEDIFADDWVWSDTKE